jgi:hypothetical protein
MKYIVYNLFKAVVCYVILALLADVIVANYTEYQISSLLDTQYDCLKVTLSSLFKLSMKILSFNFCDIKLIYFSMWIIKNKIHYPLFIFAALAIYYSIRINLIKIPTIVKRQQFFGSQKAENKKSFSEQKVKELVKSPAYQDYLKSKAKMERMMRLGKLPPEN